MNIFLYFIIAIILITNFFFTQPNTNNDIVNAQTIENETVENTVENVEEATKEISEITESLYSTNTTENSDISNKSIIKQENNTLNESFHSYEGLGIKFKYFDPWTVYSSSDGPTCYNIDLCILSLTILKDKGMTEIRIIQDKFESHTIKEKCKCNITKNYARYIYTNIISQFNNFSFIHDNQTTLSENRSAIQLEYRYKLSLENIEVYAFTIFTKDKDSFYRFTFYADPRSFSKYMSDFQKIINTIEFNLQKESEEQNQPSFMREFEEESNKTSTTRLFRD